MALVWLALPGFFIWICILFLPWRPWSTRESLDAVNSSNSDLPEVTILIPARNEEKNIATTVLAAAEQGSRHKIIIIDDQSTDKTATVVEDLNISGLELISGEPLPPDWTGKLWALQQGLQRVTTEYTLLLDADIKLQPGTLDSLETKIHLEALDLVSLMATLRMQSFWEKLLMPAFIYFFKLLYPFHLSNSNSKMIAAAAGGCILIRTDILRQIGGFEALRGELIDDCALARQVKNAGGKIWIGLTHSAASHRHYDSLASIWDMVSRTAFTQLHYSLLILLICTILLLSAYVLPVLALIFSSKTSLLLSVITLITMFSTYIPTLKYYGLSYFWALTLPMIGVLYLLMTWDSARRHWKGTGAIWKNRAYNKQIH